MKCTVSRGATGASGHGTYGSGYSAQAFVVVTYHSKARSVQSHRNGSSEATIGLSSTAPVGGRLLFSRPESVLRGLVSYLLVGRRRSGTKLLSATFLWVLLVGAGVVFSAGTASGAPLPMCGQTGRATTPIKHVLLVVLENKSYPDVVGHAGNAPFQGSLAAECGSASQMYGATHSSAANYLALTGGQYPPASTAGCSTVNACRSSAPSLFSQLENANLPWKSYVESMGSNCSAGAAPNYKIGHNPALFYPLIDCQTDDVAVDDLTAHSGALWSDLSQQTLPAFGLVIPNLVNDGDYPNSLASTDAWLQIFLGAVSQSAAYQSGSTAVVVTYDEGHGLDYADGEDCTNKTRDQAGGQPSCHIPFFVVYPWASGVDATFFDHYSVTRTIDDLFGLPPLFGAGSAASMIGHFGLHVGQAPQTPQAIFTTSCSDLTCSFNATRSTPVGLLTFAWDFGDGTTGTGMTPSRTYTAAGPHTVTLTVSDATSATATSSQPVVTKPPNASFTAITPCRVFDTRGAAGGCSASPVVPAAKVGPGRTLMVKVAGVAGVPSSATAVVLNVTAVNASTPTYLTVWPSDKARPGVSNLNVNTAAPVPNLVTVPVASDGTVSLYNNRGNVDLLADLDGYYSPTSSSGYTPLSPCRIFDTRGKAGGCAAAPAPAQAKLGAGQTKNVKIAGVGGVPSSATAVLMNVTAVNATSATYITVWPAGATRPVVSNLNVNTAAPVANLVVVPLGAGGTVTLYNHRGTVDLLADVAGYYSPTSASGFKAIAPCRIFDTRGAAGTCASAPLASKHVVGPAQTLSVRVVGVGTVPVSATAVVFNLTAVNATIPTYVTAFPTGTSRPVVSNLNASSAAPVPNLVVVPIGADGTITLYNDTGSTDLVADLAGYYSTS